MYKTIKEILVLYIQIEELQEFKVIHFWPNYWSCKGNSDKLFPLGGLQHSDFVLVDINNSLRWPPDFKTIVSDSLRYSDQFSRKFFPSLYKT